MLVNYDFASLVSETPCTATPLTTATGVSSVLTTGGINDGTCAASEGVHSEPDYAFAENKEGNLAVNLSSSAIDAVNYFQVQLTGVSAYRSYKLHFNALQSGTIDVQYSLDGVAFTSFTQLPKPNFQWRFPPTVVDLTSLTVIDRQPTVYFRLVGKCNHSPGLTFAIDNFQVQASAPTKSRKRVRFF